MIKEYFVYEDIIKTIVVSLNLLKKDMLIRYLMRMK